MTATRQRFDLSQYLKLVADADPILWTGRVTDLVGLLIESDGPAAAVGDFCEIETSAGNRVRVQAIGFRNGRVLSMPLEETSGIQLGDRVVLRPESARVTVGPELLGRVLDGFGKPMDGRGPVHGAEHYDLYREPAGPLERVPIQEPLDTGIRAIDSLLPCGKGQRVGLFGGSGVGKSTLLGAMVKHSAAQVAVVALIGERNREVRGFIEHELGEEGMARSVVVVATSDRPAPLRVRACFVALAVAEYFRDQGQDVLLVVDSVTRLAMAQREIGLAAGEPPSQKGYTPSVFNLLPKVCERPGKLQHGSITALFTVLVEGDDFNEPICDAVRGILDGHIILSRALGQAGHYPAIDILSSVSRLSGKLASADQKAAMRDIREAMADYARAEDLINLGAYAAGSNPKLDRVIGMRPRIMDFLRQDAEEHAPRGATLEQLAGLAGQLRG